MKTKQYRTGVRIDGKLFVQTVGGSWIELKLAAMAETEYFINQAV